MNYRSPSFMVLAAPRNATPWLAIETTHLLTHARSTAIHERKQLGQATNPHIWPGFC
ncbi:MAG: hypothetical protein IH808_05025 [Proteobacteria bacterium]|nr:hypothetical protein [Pseudomonadota bacterium]